MLVLTRTPGQSIKINDDISITVLPYSGRHVRIGINAAPEHLIYREEIYDRILNKNNATSIKNCDVDIKPKKKGAEL